MPGFHKVERTGFQGEEDGSVKRCGFHRHEVLPYPFEDESQAAQKASRRAAEYEKSKLKEALDLRERERMSRWYNKAAHRRDTRTKTKAPVGGPERAKARVRQYRRAKAAHEQSQREAEAAERWYLRDPTRKMAASAVEQAQEYSSRFFESQRKDEEVQKQLKAERSQVLEDKLSQIFARRDRAFSVSKSETMEALRAGHALPAFRPGAYVNDFTASYAVQACGSPRRFFSPSASSLL